MTKSPRIPSQHNQAFPHIFSPKGKTGLAALERTLGKKYAARETKLCCGGMGRTKPTTLGFTLIELLIVIGIISVLSVSAVLVLNPAELLRSGRDASRLNDAEVLTKALSLYEFATVSIGSDWDGPNYSNSCKGGSAQKIFVSVPSDNGEATSTPPLGWTYVRVPQNTLKQVNGSGWLPVNFDNLDDPSLKSLSLLPTDPVNTFASGYYYSYICGSFEINLRLESVKYMAKLLSDEGDDNNVYEVGSNLFGTPRQTFAGVSDTIDPSQPTNLSATPTSSSTISLLWDPSTDNVGITGYRIYRNSFQVAQTTGVGTSYLDQNLLASTTYSYNVSGLDAANNESPQSAPSQATTLAGGGGGDAIPPQVSITNPLAGNVSGTIVVSATSTDNVGVVGVQFKLDGFDLQGEDLASPYSIIWNTTSSVNGAHTLTALSRDLAGNTSTSLPVNITLTNDNVPPIRQNPLPVLDQIFSSSTTQVTMSLDTDETATCKYGTSDLSYSSLPNTFQNTNAFSHSQNVSVVSGNFYSYWVRCSDSLNNQNITGLNIRFSVAAGGASLPSGLVADYEFEDGGGPTAADQSGNNLTGTLVSGPAWVAGRYGGGLQFNGSGAYVDIGSSSLLSLTSGITLTSWVYPTAFSISHTALGKSGPYSLRSNQGSTALSRFSINTGTNTDLAGVTSLTLNAWNHLAGTYDGVNMRYYLNGVLDSTVAKTGLITVNTSTVGIGGAGLPFQGTLDNVRIYNRALTPSEIQTDMNTSLVVVPPDTQAPSNPTNLSATPQSSTRIDLTWTASTDNIGIAGYRIFRCQGSACSPTIQIATTTGAGTSYPNTSLTASTTYNYQVGAYDFAGNLSGLSGQSVATTFPPGGSVTETICPTGSNPRADIIWCADFENYANPSCTSNPKSAACWSANGFDAGSSDFAVLSGDAAVGSVAAVGQGNPGSHGSNTASKTIPAGSTGLSMRYYIKLKGGFMLSSRGTGDHGPVISAGCVNAGITPDFTYSGVNFGSYSTCAGAPPSQTLSNNLANPILKNEKWYSIEMQVRLNTPGASDGVFRAWIDGQKISEHTNINYQATTSNTFGILNPVRELYQGGVPPWGHTKLFDNHVLSTLTNCGVGGGDPCIGAALNENPLGTADASSPYINYISFNTMMHRRNSPSCANPPNSSLTHPDLGDSAWKAGGVLQTTIANNFYDDTCNSNLDPDQALAITINSTSTTSNGGGSVFPRLPSNDGAQIVMHGTVYLPSTNDYSQPVMLSGFTQQGCGGSCISDFHSLALGVSGGNWAIIQRNNDGAMNVTIPTAIPATLNAWHRFEIFLKSDNTLSLMMDGAWVFQDQAVSNTSWAFSTADLRYVIFGVMRVSSLITPPFTAYVDDVSVGGASFWSCKGWGVCHP